MIADWQHFHRFFTPEAEVLSTSKSLEVASLSACSNRPGHNPLKRGLTFLELHF